MTKYFSRSDIAKLIPHGLECLLINHASIRSPHGPLTTEFNCVGNEYFFNGHYANKKILPGHIIVEVLGQAGALLISEISGFNKDDVFLVTIEKMRFRKILIPPFSTQIEVIIVEKKMNMIWLQGQVYENLNLVADGKWGVQCRN